MVPSWASSFGARAVLFLALRGERGLPSARGIVALKETLGIDTDRLARARNKVATQPWLLELGQRA
jgi:hypothetical protein